MSLTLRKPSHHFFYCLVSTIHLTVLRATLAPLHILDWFQHLPLLACIIYIYISVSVVLSILSSFIFFILFLLSILFCSYSFFHSHIKHVKHALIKSLHCLHLHYYHCKSLHSCTSCIIGSVLTRPL